MPVRPATSADIPTLIDLMCRFYHESALPLASDAAKAAFEQLLADPAVGRIWICEDNGYAAGYIVLTIGFSMEYGGRDAFVDDLFVLPQFRDKGHGGQLLDTLMRECIRLGVRAVHLEADRTNQRARALYSSFGFQDNDRQLLTKKLLPAVHEREVHAGPVSAGRPSLREEKNE